MGLGLSAPFKEDEQSENVETPTKYKEIGICQMMDPRSPTNAFERTPIYYKPQKETIREQEAVVVIQDPRSPTNEITRTPLGLNEEKLTNNGLDDSFVNENELISQIERLKLFDTPTSHATTSSDNLASDKDILKPKKGILKLLDDAAITPATPTTETATRTAESIDSISLTLPNTPPCPQSESTPKDCPSPETPVVQQTEVNKLLKKKRPSNRRPRKQAPNSNQLKKAVLKKSVNDQPAPRSPLAERNIAGKGHNGIKKTTKAEGMIKYKKYSTLDESFTELFSGKENKEVAW